MKKNIVFIIPSLDAGGAEKSLVNLLDSIDYLNYNVDLVLLHNKGIFLSMIPSHVNLISLNSNYTFFSKRILPSVFSFILNLRIDLAINRFIFFCKNTLYKDKAIAEQYAWKNLRSSIQTLDKNYDVAIGYLEKSSIYFAVDKVSADRKIGWIHTTYSKSGMNADFDIKYFKKLHALIGVSPDCVVDLKSIFACISNRIHFINNMVSPKMIKSLANDKIEKNYFNNTIVTIARLSNEKGCDLAIEASKILKEKNILFKWIIIGEGSERKNLEAKIKEFNLENEFHLIGLKVNPYPYIKGAKIYLQPSRYEGKSMAIEEAKILHKPIIVTNYLTAKDQICNNFDGIIVEINPQAIANAIENLLDNSFIQEKLILNLAKSNLNKVNEIQKLYQLMNE